MGSNTAIGRHVLLLNWRDARHPEGGGSELYVERLAAELTARGYRATIFCAAHSKAEAEEVTTAGVTLLRRGSRHSVYLRAALSYLGGAVGLGRLSRRGLGRPDVLVDVGNGIPFLSRLYSRKPVIALVHHVHKEQWPVVMGRLKARFGWWVESRLAVWVYRNCQYVTVSEATKRELIALGVGARRINIVHNGTPERPDVAAVRSAQPSLVVLGRLVPHKRVEVAIKALASLSSEFPALTLTIAGAGWWEPQLRDFATELGVADRVRFTGFVSHEDKHKLLGEAWVTLAPSLKEGWGLTIVEAGTSATPSIAFAAAGGVTEALVDGETGLLAQDEDHFIKLTGELLRDSALRGKMGAAALRHAASFTWETSGTKFERLIATEA